VRPPAVADTSNSTPAATVIETFFKQTRVA
jgi:hypothetical protein